MYKTWKTCWVFRKEFRKECFENQGIFVIKEIFKKQGILKPGNF